MLRFCWQNTQRKRFDIFTFVNGDGGQMKRWKWQRHGQIITGCLCKWSCGQIRRTENKQELKACKQVGGLFKIFSQVSTQCWHVECAHFPISPFFVSLIKRQFKLSEIRVLCYDSAAQTSFKNNQIMSLLGPFLTAMYEWSNAPKAASRQIKVTFYSQYFRNMKNKFRHLAAEMITESNDCVLVKCKMEQIDTGAFEKSHLLVLCRALWSLKTMGDGVCIGATSEWSLVSNGGNTRNDLQPQFSRMTHSTQCHLVSGLGFKGSSIDVCGRSMNHFNGCFPPWSTWATPQVQPYFKVGRVNKLHKKQRWQELVAPSNRSSLTLSGKKTMGDAGMTADSWTIC